MPSCCCYRGCRRKLGASGDSEPSLQPLATAPLAQRMGIGEAERALRGGGSGSSATARSGEPTRTKADALAESGALSTKRPTSCRKVVAHELAQRRSAPNCCCSGIFAADNLLESSTATGGVGDNCRVVSSKR